MSDENMGTPTQSGSEPPKPPPVPERPSPVTEGGHIGARGRGSGVFWGVLLVVAGAFFLVAQFLPAFDVPWWALWPLFIVVGGIVQVFTPGERGWGVERVFEGIGTVIFGLVLLGNTTGYISWSVWWVLITLWPALVIALGLAILGKGLGQSWLRIASTLLVWVTLAYAVAASWTGSAVILPAGAWVGTSGQAFAFSEQGSGVTQANLKLTGGAGDIRIGSGDPLVTVAGASPFGPPAFSAKVKGDSAEVELGFNQSAGNVVVVPGMMGARMDLALSDSALWDLAFETGATSMDADLSKIRVRDMELKTGASAATIKLGDVPSGERESTLVVKSGVSTVRILLPADAEARVEARSGLVANDVAGRFVRQGGVWQTPGYSSAAKTWDIRTEAGVGSVSIDTY